MTAPARSQLPASDFSTLDANKVADTIEVLARRVRERFPDASLVDVCQRLWDVARRVRETTEWIRAPISSIRVITGMLIIVLVVGIISVVFGLKMPSKSLDLLEFVQAVESGINDLVLVGAGIFFLVSLETRIKRRRALDAINELRSLLHIIDMHQLTKDPHHVHRGGMDTASSPRRLSDAVLLRRYLEYCIEMQSLTAKLAALYAQHFDDAVVLAAVNEIETLAASMSARIGQKIILLQRRQPAAEASAT